MKIYIKAFLQIIAVLAVIIFISSCTKKKKDEATPTPPTPTGSIGFHMHTNIDTTEVDSGMVALDMNGRQIQLNIAQFYVSGIKLKKADGSTYALDGVIYMKDIATEEYILSSTVPAGNYTSVSFNVGVDATNNAKDPSSFSASSALAPKTPNMWFGSTTQGYMFMNVQGFADTTSTNTGAVNVPFSYQLGTSAMLTGVTMPNKAFTIVANQTALVHISCDYGMLLQGINFKTQSTGTPFVNASVATQVANNVSMMFSYEM